MLEDKIDVRIIEALLRHAKLDTMNAAQVG